MYMDRYYIKIGEMLTSVLVKKFKKKILFLK